MAALPIPHNHANTYTHVGKTSHDEFHRHVAQFKRVLILSLKVLLGYTLQAQKLVINSATKTATATR